MSLASVTGLDHFVIRVPDLDKAQAALVRLGFTLSPRGFHDGRGSANHTVPLNGGDYFELLSFPPEQVGAFPVVAPDFEGPVAVALQTQDSRQIHADLTALGYDVPEPRDLSRPVDLPGGAQTARFLNQSFPPLQPSALTLFACQQRTRELVWRPEWQTHPNGAQRITAITLVHPTPADLRPQYARLFETEIPDGDELVVLLGRTRLRFVSPRRFAEQTPSIAIPTDLANGWFAGATLAVSSLDRVAALLTDVGITPTTTPHGIAVTPDHACGTVLAFEQGAA
jgi:catechol 2,3-dioxygenase-like lactoylglutathione lyase family enzyme